MTSETKAETDYASFESTLTISVRATKVEYLGYDGSGPDEHEKHGYTEMTFEQEGRLVYQKVLGTSLINLDHYLTPVGDWIGDVIPAEKSIDDGEIWTGYTDIEVTPTLYESELRQAAKQRAAEDGTHEINVLAAWLWQAGGADHISPGAATVFWSALRDELQTTDNPPDWALCYDGDPENWRHEGAPINDLDEAATYLNGGYAPVMEARDDE